MDISRLKNILQAILLAADRSLTVVQLEALFELDEERPTRDEIRQALHEMEEDYAPRGYELKRVASGFRLQVRQEYATWVGRLWEEKPARYTRALLETMALIAYRQPITRGEIEEVRGVSVSSNIVKTLLERDWIKVLGHKDVPGKPTLYGTTKEFLDYFNLNSLDQLPTLAEIKDLDSIHPELALEEDSAENASEHSSETPNENSAEHAGDSTNENLSENKQGETTDLADGITNEQDTGPLVASFSTGDASTTEIDVSQNDADKLENSDIEEVDELQATNQSIIGTADFSSSESPEKDSEQQAEDKKQAFNA